MSECPEYYRVSDGREFWEFFRDECHTVIEEYCLLNQSQCHAIESACEYLYRAGVKTVDPSDDIHKAFRLIDRAVGMEEDKDSRKQCEAIISEIIGKVMLERARKLISEKPQSDPHRTVWGKIDIRHTYTGGGNA